MQRRKRAIQDLKFKIALAPGVAFQWFDGSMLLCRRPRLAMIQWISGFNESMTHSAVPASWRGTAGKTPRPSSGRTRMARSIPTYGVRNLFWLRYADECGTGGSGFLWEAIPAYPACAEMFPRLYCPFLDLRQRENSSQYLASSWAASL